MPLSSATLSQLLANKLKQRLPTDGMIEYNTIWRVKVTPLGVSYWEHSALVPRINAKDYTGLQLKTHWITPLAGETKVFTPGRLSGFGELTGNVMESLIFGPTMTYWRKDMENTAELNPAFSLWLMGFRCDWLMVAPEKLKAG